MWGFGVIVVNAYVWYYTSQLYIWCQKPTSILTHYEFQKKLALSLLDPSSHYKHTTGGQYLKPTSILSC